MKSTKDYLLLILAVSTISCAVLAWRQYDELLALHGAAAMNSNERAEWQKRLWAVEKRRTALEEQVAAKKAAPEVADAEDAAPAPTGERSGPRRNNRGDRAGEFMAMMDKPEIQKLMALQQKAVLDSRYASLFKNLNLAPAQLDQFKNLLVEKQTSMMDVLAAARAQGINPRSDPQAFKQMITDAQGEIDNSIKSALGEVGYAQYKNYEQTGPQRNTVSQLEQRLSYTSTPLSTTQSDQMIAILASTTTPQKPGDQQGRNLAFMGGPGGAQTFFGGNTAKITDATITQSQGVLAADQVAALKQLQQEQEAQAQLAKNFRAQFGGSSSNGSNNTPATPTTKKAGPGGG